MTRPFSSAFLAQSQLLLGSVALLSTTGLLACGSARAGASAHAEADEHNFDVDKSAWAQTETEPEESDNTRARKNPKPSASPAPTASVAKAPPNASGIGLTAGGASALLGARHDLELGSAAKLQCQCLRAAIGIPNSPSFRWLSAPPSIDEANQIVVAFSAETSCAAGTATGASYMGYHSEGGDLVIELEKAHAGRPLTRGAIVPRPAEGGQIYLEPQGGIPHGKGPQGEPRCALGR